eukprot:COSAG06_NODE_64549_length_259_cov_0.650000_1_plen_31_part_01
MEGIELLLKMVSAARTCETCTHVLRDHSDLV